MTTRQVTHKVIVLTLQLRQISCLLVALRVAHHRRPDVNLLMLISVADQNQCQRSIQNEPRLLVRVDPAP